MTRPLAVRSDGVLLPADKDLRGAPAGPKAVVGARWGTVDRGSRTRMTALLQQAAGNAAVQRWVADANAGSVPVQRCGGDIHHGCLCAEEATAAETAPSAPDVRVVQRVPAYRPHNAWTTKDSKQGPLACAVLPERLATASWALWSRSFPFEAGSRCGCPIVTDVWNAYFTATGTPRFVWSEARDGRTCIILSLKNDDDHRPYEAPILAAAVAAVPTLLPRLRGVSSVRVPLVDIGVSGSMLTPPLNLNDNTRVGGSLFGDVGSSEYGPDTRQVNGTLELTKQLDPDNRLFIQVLPRLDLHWHIIDGVDFCPGGTGESVGGLLQTAVTAVSQLEASGLARDIYVEADYTRVRFDVPQGPFPNPDFIGSTQPRLITVPARVLFDFGSDQLRPQAATELFRALGTQPDHAVLSQPVQVRGHTDSRGSEAFNQGLSERRAAAVQRLLEQRYPDLRGHIVARGFGETQPIAPNDIGGRDNPEGRRQNRRVEIEFVEIAPD